VNTFELEVLALAFARHVLDELAQADSERTSDELALMEQICPVDRLRAAGLIDANGLFTPAWTEARAQALDRLPRELSYEGKMSLLTSFFEMCVVDGYIDRSEGSLLFQTASLLGVRPSELDAHLDTLTEHVGTVELDTPEI
jgi:uncharacterized tellurite resistance protein B-like protein